MSVPQASTSVMGMHHTSTHGIAPAHRPSASMTPGITRKLRLDLGREVLLIALGDDPKASIKALRDDLTKILEDSK